MRVDKSSQSAKHSLSTASPLSIYPKLEQLLLSSQFISRFGLIIWINSLEIKQLPPLFSLLTHPFSAQTHCFARSLHKMSFDSSRTIVVALIRLYMSVTFRDAEKMVPNNRKRIAFNIAIFKNGTEHHLHQVSPTSKL